MSALQFTSHELVASIRDLLQAQSLDGTALELELTGSALMTAIDQVESTLAAMGATGICIRHNLRIDHNHATP